MYMQAIYGRTRPKTHTHKHTRARARAKKHIHTIVALAIISILAKFQLKTRFPEGGKISERREESSGKKRRSSELTAAVMPTVLAMALPSALPSPIT